MKSKISRGSGFRGVAAYAFGKEKDAIFVTGNVTGRNPRTLASEFAAARQIRPDIARPVWHSSLTLPAGERLDGDRWESVVNDYLDGMGFNRDNNQFFAVRHNDTEYDHVHVIASRVGLDGSVWHGKWEARRAIDLTQELEQKHGLTPTKGLPKYVDQNGKLRIDRSDERRLTHNELNMVARTGNEATRDVLKRLVREAAKGNPTASQFADRLALVGVEVRANIANTGTMSGFSFGLDGLAFSGSKLGKSFTWGSLQKAGMSYVEDRDRARLEQLTARAATAAGDPDCRGIAGPGGVDQPVDGGSDRRDPAGDDRSGGAPEPGSGPDGSSSGSDGSRRIEGRKSRPERDESRVQSPEGPPVAGAENPDDHIPGGDGFRPRELASGLRALASRNTMTPAKAAQAISDAVAENPAPKPNSLSEPPTPLARWYSGLKSKLARAIGQARSFFQDVTYGEAKSKGWRESQITAAGVERPPTEAAQRPQKAAEEGAHLNLQKATDEAVRPSGSNENDFLDLDDDADDLDGGPSPG